MYTVRLHHSVDAETCPSGSRAPFHVFVKASLKFCKCSFRVHHLNSMATERNTRLLCTALNISAKFHKTCLQFARARVLDISFRSDVLQSQHGSSAFINVASLNQNQPQ